MSDVFDSYAAYYDLLYRDKDYAGETRFVRDLLCGQGMESGELLELGCGTGKHAEHLARMGYSVHGVDFSAAMVESAQQHLSTDLMDRLSFEIGDARNVRIGRKFDSVISLFHVASYQTTNEDIKAMFETASGHLNTGGLFIFDFWYGPGVLTDRPVVRTKRLSDDKVEVLRIAEPVMHPNENSVDVNYSVMVTNRLKNNTAELKEKHTMRYFFMPELSSMLGSAGFEIKLSAEWKTGNRLDFDTWLGVICAERID